eukprot:IDg3106t1
MVAVDVASSEIDLNPVMYSCRVPYRSNSNLRFSMLDEITHFQETALDKDVENDCISLFECPYVEAASRFIVADRAYVDFRDSN